MAIGFRKGDRIRHPRLTEWGLGEVLENSVCGEVRAFFVGVGEKKLSLSHVQPERITGAEAAHPLLDSLKLRANSDTSRYRGIEQAKAYFLSQFPGGFHGKRFAEHERNYKDKARLQMAELLDHGACKQLLDAGDHDEICARARRMLNATNLVFPNEKSALKDGLSDAGRRERFARSLLALLHGERAIEGRFKAFVGVLEDIGAAKWTTATYFLYFGQPQSHMFVKPTITQHAAEVCGFEINYRPQPNWQTYSSVLQLCTYLQNELKDLEPRDMIDIQSFMWCIAPGNY